MKTLVLLFACVSAALADDIYSPYLPYYPVLSLDKKDELKYENKKIKVEPIYRPTYALEYPYKIIGRHGFGFNLRTLLVDGLRKPLIAEHLVPIKEVIERINGEASKREYSE